MHPLANLSIAIGTLLIFISSVLLITETELEFVEIGKVDDSVEFDLSGQSGNLTFTQSTETKNLGWAVYVYGSYTDSNQNGKWDTCEGVETFAWREGEEKPPQISHENNTYYPFCETGSERYDLLDQSLIYVGQICHNPSNYSDSICSTGVYNFSSNYFSQLVPEEEKATQSLASELMERAVMGIRTGWSILCGGFSLVVMGGLLGVIIEDESEPVMVKKKSGPTAEWRAYALSQTERGEDGLPKAFSRHVMNKNLFKKPKKGNVRGGVHKEGGLFLDGWDSSDSDKEYKKKVQDRRNR
ncbi:MAG: hypothetical protein QF911_02630 [Candidatus Thalassarchaeaceae archaeon]|jgi:hypothetical protein|nr:hypothetical protein [Candidatus Thalassarchaeaceae archaeon]